MDKHFKWKMLFIIGVTAFCLWKVYPPQEKIHLGLDLKGGMQLLLKIDLSKLPKEAQKDASERAVEVIRKPNIQQYKSNMPNFYSAINNILQTISGVLALPHYQSRNAGMSQNF